MQASILHVPYTYFPDASGGTEVYVRALAQLLERKGYDCAVGAPGQSDAAYIDAGVPVRRFRTDDRPLLEHAYGAADPIALQGFRAILAEFSPHIVHLHARTSAVSGLLADAAHDAGARVVFTYHTPAVSCARGTMMLFGESACDGRVDARRCIACALQGMGLPAPAARLAAVAAPASRIVPPRYSKSMPKHLRIPGLLASGAADFHAFMHKADRVVAVCDWVRDLLVRNGVPDDKIALSRQGISQSPVGLHPAGGRDSAAPLRLAYFGRIDWAKGPEILAAALALIPHADVRIDFYAVLQGGEALYSRRFQTQVEADARLSVLSPVASETIIEAMSQYDAIAVPSRCLETGPLVVHEALAAGVPVIGTRLGGIAELVRHEVDGILVDTADPAAWAVRIENLLGDRAKLEALRASGRVTRTMHDVAGDMAQLYRALLGEETLPCDDPAMPSGESLFSQRPGSLRPACSPRRA